LRVNRISKEIKETGILANVMLSITLTNQKGLKNEILKRKKLQGTGNQVIQIKFLKSKMERHGKRRGAFLFFL